VDFFESLSQLKQKMNRVPMADSTPVPIDEPVCEEDDSSTIDILQWIDQHPNNQTGLNPQKVIFPSTKENGNLAEAFKSAKKSKPKPNDPISVIKPADLSAISEPIEIVSPAEEPRFCPEDWAEEDEWDHSIDPEQWFSHAVSEKPTDEHNVVQEAENPFEEIVETDGTEILDHLDQYGIALKSVDFVEKRKRGEEGVYRSKGAVEKTIDLHGMPVRDAELKIIRTFENAKIRGYQQVLIIHGRGNHSAGGDSKMKRMVMDLLEGSLSSKVSSFTFAPFSEGGGGATRVILK